MTGTMALVWLLRVLVGGGLVLLLARLLMAGAGQPARRQRLGEWGMAAALLVAVLSFAPAWLVVTVPGPATPAPTESAVRVGSNDDNSNNAALEPGRRQRGDGREEVSAIDPFAHFPLPPAEAVDVPPVLADPEAKPEPAARAWMAAEEPPDTPKPATFWISFRADWPTLLVSAYALVAAVLLGRLVLGHLVLWRLLRAAEPAPEPVARLFKQMTAGRSRPRLLVSRRWVVPFSCGLLRPTVVLPAALCEATPEALRWVFAHELTHLERRDAWANWLFGVGQAAYYCLPWFWGLRRQVRLDQEYVADAAAAGTGRPEDYAQFLLGWTAAPALPAAATGVMGRSSDLYRRVTMLLQSSAPLERRCPRRWSLAAAGLLIPAVLLGGIGLRAVANPDVTQKDDTNKDDKKDAAKKDDKKKDDFQLPPGVPFPNVDDILKNLPPGADADMIRKQMMEARDRMMKQMMDARNRAGAWGAPGMAFNPFGRSDRSRLGAIVESPSATLVEQLDLPKKQGLVIEDVQADSAAGKAGLKPHDILLELNGKAVSSDVSEFIRMLDDIKADKAVDAVVLRKGKRETIKGLTLPEAKKDNVGGFFPGGFPPGGVGGAGFAGGGGFGGVGGGGFVPPGGFPGGGGGIGLPGGFPGMPGMPGGAGGIGIGGMGGFGGKGVMTTTFRANDRFTTRHQEGSLVITVTGKVADGKATTSEILVQDGNESHKYESVDKVPERYRDKVKNLVDMTEKSNIKIEIK